MATARYRSASESIFGCRNRYCSKLSASSSAINVKALLLAGLALVSLECDLFRIIFYRRFPCRTKGRKWKQLEGMSFTAAKAGLCQNLLSFTLRKTVDWWIRLRTWVSNLNIGNGFNGSIGRRYCRIRFRSAPRS